MIDNALAVGNETYRQLVLFGDVFEKIRTDYVEKPDDAKLIESAINGMLSYLDPHSSYLNPKAFKDMQEQKKEGGGIGVEINKFGDLIKITHLIDGSPAFRAGLMADDAIQAIDDETVNSLTINQVRDKLVGPLNSKVGLKIFRKLKSDTFTVMIPREIIKISPVISRNEGDIGYIKINQFTEKTFDSLKASLDEFARDIPSDITKGYIIDLRNDPGGSLDQAIAVSDAFLERGEIVSTQGRYADGAQRYMAHSGDLAKGKPLIVLINGGSASAAEIVAGSLQDHKRATIVGTRSIGQGTVQSIIQLGINGALRLTTAMLYLPSGRTFQTKGIDPDIQIQSFITDQSKEKNQVTEEALSKLHLTNTINNVGDFSTFVPSDPKQDEQLNYALSLLRRPRT